MQLKASLRFFCLLFYFATNMKSLLFILLAVFISTSFANTEKLILEAKSANVKAVCNKNSDAPSLTPPYTKIQQSLIPYSENNKGSPHWYHLNDLKDGSNYEVRISYPAIVKLVFFFFLMCLV